MTGEGNNWFRLILYNVYRVKSNSTTLVSTEFHYQSQRHGAQKLSVLDPGQKPTGSLKQALTQLQPLARNLFVDPKTEISSLQQPHEKLMHELKSVWQSKAPAWAQKKIEHLLFEEPQSTKQKKKQFCFRFSFHDAGKIRLENSISVAFLIIEPCCLPQTCASPTHEEKGIFARMMVNRLYYRGRSSEKNKRTAALQRIGRGTETRQEHLREAFANNSLPLIRGLLGDKITMEDIFDSLAGPDSESMLNDRFLCQSLLVTAEDNDEPTFTEAEYMNLARLAKGQNDRYLPPDKPFHTDFVILIRTFRNIQFIATGEGLACHVKPGKDQSFLTNEFRERYKSIYLLLFVLAVYQRYRLAHLIFELDSLLPEQEQLVEGNSEKEIVEKLRQLRMQTAHHALRIMNTQPTFLTNYRELYEGLQQAFGIRELGQKVRQSTAEIEYLLGDRYRREQEKEKIQFDTAKVILAMLAEIVALPYYLYNLLEHLFKFSSRAVAVLTLLATGGTVVYTWTKMPRKKIPDKN